MFKLFNKYKKRGGERMREEELIMLCANAYMKGINGIKVDYSKGIHANMTTDERLRVQACYTVGSRQGEIDSLKAELKIRSGVIDESSRIAKGLTEDMKRDNEKFEDGIKKNTTDRLDGSIMKSSYSEYLKKRLTDDEVETLYELLQKCRYDDRFSAKVKEFDDWCITKEAIHITCSKTIKLCEELKNNREKRSDV